jgi:hypothetical protein
MEGERGRYCIFFIGWQSGTVDLLVIHLSYAPSGLLVHDVFYKCQYSGI